MTGCLLYFSLNFCHKLEALGIECFSAIMQPMSSLFRVDKTTTLGSFKEFEVFLPFQVISVSFDVNNAGIIEMATLF